MDSKDSIVLAICTALPPTLMALAALVTSWNSRKASAKKIEELRVTVDGRLSKLLALTGSSEHAKGMLQGALEGEGRRGDARAEGVLEGERRREAHDAGVAEGKGVVVKIDDI